MNFLLYYNCNKEKGESQKKGDLIMTMFIYNVWFHITKNEITKQHWDEMMVSADCLANARYETLKRIQTEFDYPANAVDKIEIYNEDHKLLKTYEM